MAAAPTPPDLARLRIADAERAPRPSATRSLARTAGIGALVLGAALAAWLIRGAVDVEVDNARRAAITHEVPPPERNGATSGSSPAAAANVSGAVLAGGRVESSERRELAFAQAGVVGVVHVARGQRVKAGDVLVELDNRGERAAVDESRAALAAAEARLQELSDGARPEELLQAQRDLDAANAVARDADDKETQAKKLAAKGIVTRADELEATHAAEAARARAQSAEARLSLVSRGARRTSLSTAQAEVSRMRAALAAAEARFAATKLLAPVDGNIVELRVRSGEATGAQAQAPAAVVMTDPERLEVHVDVPEAKATRVKRGDQASITVEALGDVAFSGHVVSVGLEADRQKGTIEVVATFDDSADRKLLARVRPRMAARMAIEPSEPSETSDKE